VTNGAVSLEWHGMRWFDENSSGMDIWYWLKNFQCLRGLGYNVRLSGCGAAW
jgi:hypothetical protein